MVWKSHRAATNFELFRQSNSYFSISCFNFLIQDLDLKLSLFGRLFDLNLKDIVLCVGIGIVPKCQNSLIIDKSLPSGLFFRNYRFDLSDQSRPRNASTFHGVSGLKTIDTILSMIPWYSKIVGSFQKIWTNFDFSKKNWLGVFLQGLNLTFFTFVGICDQKSLLFFHALESWWVRNARKFFWSWHASLFKLISFSPSSFIFPLKCKLISFYSRRTIRFWKSKFCPLHQNWNPDWQNLAKCY